MMLAEFLEYRRKYAELQDWKRQAEATVAKFSSSIIELALLSATSPPGMPGASTMMTAFHTKDTKQVSRLKATIQTLTTEKKTMEKKFHAEKALLESKVELHKKSLKFLEENSSKTNSGQQILPPSSITSNKLINHNTANFSTTPYLQKIKAIKASRVTPINSAKILSASNFSTSTPDTRPPPAATELQTPTIDEPALSSKKKNITSPLRALLTKKSSVNAGKKALMFEEDEQDFSTTREEDSTTDRKFKKIKLSSKNKKRAVASDDENDENDDDIPKSPVLKRLKFGANTKKLSPLKTNNMFKI